MSTSSCHMHVPTQGPHRKQTPQDAVVSHPLCSLSSSQEGLHLSLQNLVNTIYTKQYHLGMGRTQTLNPQGCFLPNHLSTVNAHTGRMLCCKVEREEMAAQHQHTPYWPRSESSAMAEGDFLLPALWYCVEPGCGC